MRVLEKIHFCISFLAIGRAKAVLVIIFDVPQSSLMEGYFWVDMFKYSVLCPVGRCL